MGDGLDLASADCYRVQWTAGQQPSLFAMNRRLFSKQLLLAGGGATFPRASRLSAQENAAGSQPGAKREICAFIKFVQSLSYNDLGEAMVGAGFDGIEATVRKGGIIPPESAADELPKLAEAMQSTDCGITLLATDINRADHPLTEKVLRAAAAAGVKRYRTAYYRYDLDKPIRAQLVDFRAMARDLAAMNRELGLTGVYQNHAGAKYAGASIWDLDEILAGLDPDDFGVAFDIRHATAEGGTTWPVLWRLIESRVRMAYVKDFVWKNRKPHNVPLGEGLVNPDFAELLGQSARRVPVSVHVEYLRDGSVEQNIAALRNARETLAKWLKA